MEVFASVGAEAQDIFSDGDGMRPEMPAKRLDILREDVRDLVDLTAGRMQVFLVGGALLAQLCVFFFCEGRMEASAPPFLLSLFLLSNTCALVYLLLAVWLSMHASVVSRSLGARLLTRFVRPPIPSLSRTGAPRSPLEDFLPQRDERARKRTLPSEEPAGAGGPCATGEPSSPGVAADTGAGDPGSGPQHLPRQEDRGSYAGASDGVDAPTSESRGPTERDGTRRRPGAAARTLHAQLFRRLQGKWLCFDLCCSVSMFLGANQTLQGLAYYAIARTLAEGRSGATGCAMLLILQAAAAALAILDIAGLQRSCVLLIQALGAAPALLAAIAVALAQRTPEGALDPDAHFGGIFSCVVFWLQALWLEALLRVAAPSADGASATLFRSAPFLDVFGETCDPTEERGPLPETRTQLAAGGEQVAVAEHALAFAEAAIARWEAVPEGCLSDEQQRTLDGLAVDAGMWARALRGELAWHRAVGADGLERDGGDALPQDREDLLAPWWLAGPFKTADGRLCYYGDGRVWEEPMDRPVLTLEDVGDMVRALEEAVRGLLGSRPEPPLDPHTFATRVASDIVGAAGWVSPALLNGWRSCLPILQRVHRWSVVLGRRLSRVWPLWLPAPVSGRWRRSRAPPPWRSSCPSRWSCQRAAAPAPESASRRGRPAPPLPWQVLRGVTRVLQVAWGFTGTMAMLREWGVFDQVRDIAVPDAAVPQSTTTTPAPDTRRPLDFELLRMKWPFGGVGFDLDAMSCTSGGVNLTTTLGNKYGAKVRGEGSGSVLLQPPQQPDLEFCTQGPLSDGVPRVCLSGSLDRRGLTLGSMARNIEFGVGIRTRDAYGQQTRTYNEFGDIVGKRANTNSTIDFVGKPWLRVEGALMSCPAQAAGLDQLVVGDSGNLDYAAGSALRSAPRTEGRTQHLCLLLVGWDGEKLPVAMAKLSIDRDETPRSYNMERSNMAGSTSPPVSAIAYSGDGNYGGNVFNLQLISRSVAPQFALRAQHDGPVLGMHLSPHPSLPVWILLPGGHMETWKLAPFRPSPSVFPAFRLKLQPQLWLHTTATPTQQENSTFEVRAACGDVDGRLLVVGMGRRGSGAEERPQLIRSAIPMPL